MLEEIQHLEKIPSLNAMTLACRRRGIPMSMRLTRKVFASYPRASGIQPEVIDLLQGRVAQSVLIRHYLVPKTTFKDDVLSTLHKLKQEMAK